jgi:D-alanyl-lipoteichoic acid acyltransferase DltB (MBOAT superfamily)
MQSIAEAFRKLFSYDPANPMLFNSGTFLLLFTVFISLYALLYRNWMSRTVYVIAFSLFFYYKASGWYLLILLLSICMDYWVALAIYNSPSQPRKKMWMLISVGANLALLGYFKYTNFFIESWNAVSRGELAPKDIFLPIGISFYTFQTISYVVDVYKGKIAPARNLLDYTFYMSFFPHLVAGPIVRAKDFLPQLQGQVQLEADEINEGFYLVIKGLIKKAIIADYIAQYADLIFGNPTGYSGFENLMGVYAYTLQIYCDFSGYSDMAIGIAKFMGFRLGDNFNTPYASKDITEFWRRWHISLSTWLRDYVYIPLGGNRKGEFNQYLFLLATMLVGGLWHGPSWKFVAWGGLHGLALVIHKLYSRHIGNRIPKNGLRNFTGWFLCFHYVAFLWVFFRADTFGTAMEVFRQVFTQMDLSYLPPFLKARGLFCIMLVAGYGLQFLPEKIKLSGNRRIAGLPLVGKAILLFLAIELVLQLQTADVKPFIYFQF